MQKVIILVVGLIAGYTFGFKDAKAHDKNIATRAIGKIGGGSRDRVKSTVDEKMKEAEKP
jgi:hypothetical protein